MNKKSTPFLLVLFFISFFLKSCSWFDKEVQVPAYIYIPAYTFEASSGEGTSSHNITDAWVYVNDQKIGAFELPAMIPVLESGDCNIKVYAGIKLNGTAATRAAYTFYNFFEQDVYLIPDSIISIAPHTTYLEGLTFEFIEDFETVGLVFEKTQNSDTTINKINDPVHVFEGTSSGEIALAGSIRNCMIKTIDHYELPKTGGFSFIELNCKGTIPFVVGVYANMVNFSTAHEIVYVTPSETWKKLYINLTPTVSRHQSALDFDIFIATGLSEEENSGKVWLDNIKLVRY